MAASDAEVKEISYNALYDEYTILTESRNVSFAKNVKTPQWSNPGDFFAKFSLYPESSNAATTTDTSSIPKV